MTVQEIWLGVPLHQQQEKLDQGYTLQPHASGPRRTEYVMAIRDAGPTCRIARSMDSAVIIFGVSRLALIGNGQYPAVFQARAACMKTVAELGASYNEIGRHFKRDWSTVRNAVRRCEEFQDEDWGYRHACERLLRMVKEA